MSSRPRISPLSMSLTELLAHALAIEAEAVHSYQDLALQMDASGNREVAGLFEKMAVLEAGHAARIRESAGTTELAELAPWEYRWKGLEAPENIDLNRVHYLMSAHQALSLALENELNAQAFFEIVAEDCTDTEVRALALDFAADERQHVAWMREWLDKYPQTAVDWDADPDPPAALD